MRLPSCLLLLVLLVGCDTGPARIDGTSEATFRESVKKVRASLSPEKLKEFDESVGAVTADAMMASGLRPGASPDAIKQGMYKALNGKTADEVIAEGKKAKAGHDIPF